MAVHPLGGEPGEAAVEGHSRGEAPTCRCAAGHCYGERGRLAAFVLDEATAFAANPFPSTTAGVARQRWGLREIEFEAMEIAAAGLPCLLAALPAYRLRKPLATGDPADTGPRPYLPPSDSGRAARRSGAAREASSSLTALFVCLILLLASKIGDNGAAGERTATRPVRDRRPLSGLPDIRPCPLHRFRDDHYRARTASHHFTSTTAGQLAMPRYVSTGVPAEQPQAFGGTDRCVTVANTPLPSCASGILSTRLWLWGLLPINQRAISIQIPFPDWAIGFTGCLSFPPIPLRALAHLPTWELGQWRSSVCVRLRGVSARRRS